MVCTITLNDLLFNIINHRVALIGTMMEHRSHGVPIIIPNEMLVFTSSSDLIDYVVVIYMVATVDAAVGGLLGYDSIDEHWHTRP
jgi:hypothetical protein